MTDDLDKLEAIARRATPGPWELDDDGRCAAVLTADGFGVAMSFSFANVRTAIAHGRDDSLCTAQYIAAFSPDVVLRLIARLRALEPCSYCKHAEREHHHQDGWTECAVARCDCGVVGR